MTPTEELRELLDAAGVRWKRVRGHKSNGTSWHDRYGSYVEAVQEYAWDGGEFPEGKMVVRRGPAYMTPEQAIAATLGRETCRIRDEECDQCGAIIHEHANMCLVPVGEGMRTVKHRDVHFCPNCGRRVVDE